jgi:hypothetical protein
MESYTCILCNYNTKLKANYTRHLKTNKHKRNLIKENECSEEFSNTNDLNKNKMTPNEPKRAKNEPKRAKNEPKRAKNEPEKNQKFVCDFCDKEFSSHANKRKHEIHRCKENISILNERKKWDKEKKILYKQIDALIKKAGNTTTNNLNLNSYGHEDLSHITNSFKNNLIKGPFGMIPKMIEAVHFNKEKPENKNITYPNKKHNNVKIFKEGEWKYYNKDELMDEMIENNYYILDIHYDEKGDNVLNDVQKKRYREFKDKYDNGGLDKGIKDDINIILLNG